MYLPIDVVEPAKPLFFSHVKDHDRLSLQLLVVLLLADDVELVVLGGGFVLHVYYHMSVHHERDSC